MKTNLFKLSAILLFLLCAVSCSDNKDGADNPLPDTPPVHKWNQVRESTDNYDITYRFNEKVIRFSKTEISDYLIRIENDSILYWSTDTPTDLLPAIGSLLSCDMSEETPYGLGHKVISITKTDNYYKYVTTTAYLEELFDELHLETQVSEITDISNEYIDSNGYTYNVRIGEADNVQPKSRASEGEWGIGAKFGVDVNPAMKLVIDFQHPERNELTFNAAVTFTGSVKLEGEIKLTRKDHTLFKAQLVPVQVGPVTIVPVIELTGGLTGTISGEFGLDFEKSFYLEGGYRNNQSYRNEHDVISSSETVKSLALDVEGSVGPEIEISVGAGIFHPALQIGAKAGADAKFSTKFLHADPTLFSEPKKLDFGINAGLSIFAKAKIWKLKAEISADLVSLEFLHLQWPLTPVIEENTFLLSPMGEPNAFNAEYTLNGGLISRFTDVYPAIGVFEKENEIYRNISDTPLSSQGKESYDFDLADLDPDTHYEVYPAISMFGNIYYSDVKADTGHPHFIDFNLPSGTLWSCCNLGARDPSELGEYYRLSEGQDSVKSILGEQYSIPTKAQFEELLKHTKQKKDVIGRTAGVRFVGANGVSIFMPAAAHLYWDGEENTWDINNLGSGAYWSTTPSVDEGYNYFLEFDNEEDTPFFGDRDIDMNKLSVRPVCRKSDIKK